MKPIEESIRTRTSVYTVLGPGLIEQRVKQGAVQSIADAQANCATFIKLVRRGQAALLVDLSEAGPTDPGVNEVYASPFLAEHAVAVALVTGTMVGSMIGNLFLTFTRPPMPTKLFDSREDALQWLQEYQQDIAASHLNVG